MAVGDDAVPGIGQRKLSSIQPHERTTPAGRFVASLDRNLRGAEILWVDYEGAVSLHPVVAGSPSEQRALRLSSPTPRDNRISYGCINVPVAFFANVVKPAFTGTDGVVYVLPETRPVHQVFGSYDVDARALTQSERSESPTWSASGSLTVMRSGKPATAGRMPTPGMNTMTSQTLCLCMIVKTRRTSFWRP